MAIDSSIALGYRPVQMESPLNQLAQVMQIRGAQNQNALAQYQIAQAQRQDADTNALNRLWQGAVNPDGTVNRTKLVSDVAADGRGSQIPGLLQRFSEQDKAQAEVDHKKAQTAEVNAKTLNASLEQSRSMLNNVNDPQSAARWVAANFNDPILSQAYKRSGASLDQLIARIPTDQQGFADWKMRNSLGAEKLIQMTTPDANAQLQAQTSRANNAASVAATIRGQDLVNDRAKEKNEIDKGAVVGKQTRETEMKLADDYRTESKGFAETSTAMKKIVGAIDTADKNPGAALAAGTAFMKLLDPNSVVRESELGMALNASGWFDRAMNIANTLKNGKVMTAEQKVNLRKASEDLFEEAKAAQREIDASYTKRASDYGADPKRVIVDRGQASGRPALAAGGPVKLTAANADAEYAKLPSGAEFIAPDGSRRRKP